MPKAKTKKSKLSPEWHRELARKRNWVRKKRLKSKVNTATGECVPDEDESIVPMALSRLISRLKGPTISSALDGLTYEETRDIDLSKFDISARWRPYIAKKENGENVLLFRARPMHHDQKSGGKVFQEEIDRENAQPGKVRSIHNANNTI